MRYRAALLVVALVVAPGSAAADGGAFRDPDEQPFCESQGACPDSDYMDFRRLSYGHGEGPRSVRHGIRTIKRWRTKALGGRHGTTIAIDVDTDGDARVERELRVRRKAGELVAVMFRGKYLRKKVGAARAWRPDRRSVKVEFSLRLLGDGVTDYRWRAFRWERGIACPGSCHTDFAPNRGWYEHHP